MQLLPCMQVVRKATCCCVSPHSSTSTLTSSAHSAAVCVVQVELPYRDAADAEEQDAAGAAEYEAMEVDGEEAEEATQAGGSKKGKGEECDDRMLLHLQPALWHVPGGGRCGVFCAPVNTASSYDGRQCSCCASCFLQMPQIPEGGQLTTEFLLLSVAHRT
jgi:hypothetical protein